MRKLKGGVVGVRGMFSHSSFCSTVLGLLCCILCFTMHRIFSVRGDADCIQANPAPRIFYYKAMPLSYILHSIKTFGIWVVFKISPQITDGWSWWLSVQECWWRNQSLNLHLGQLLLRFWNTIAYDYRTSFSLIISGAQMTSSKSGKPLLDSSGQSWILVTILSFQLLLEGFC